MPGGRAFIDSSTFLYTFDEAAGTKRTTAQRWLAELTRQDRGVTNLQVLNEVTCVSTRKGRRFGDDPFVRVDAFASFGDNPLSAESTLASRDLFRRYGYSWWDCLLLASALELGCSHFLSEDMQDGQRIEAAGKALTIVSPFAHAPEQVLG